MQVRFRLPALFFSCRTYRLLFVSSYMHAFALNRAHSRLHGSAGLPFWWLCRLCASSTRGILNDAWASPCHITREGTVFPARRHQLLPPYPSLSAMSRAELFFFFFRCVFGFLAHIRGDSRLFLSLAYCPSSGQVCANSGVMRYSVPVFEPRC